MHIALETFLLGTHQPHWLGLTEVPLFVSRRRLCRRKTLPCARGVWALDSGGYTELSMFGRWTVSPRRYAEEARRYAAEIGKLAWAAPMDHMVEPWVLARTGLSVREHQRLTLENYLELRHVAPDLPWVPVLQGWSNGEYIEHAAAYDRAGVRLASLPLVGVGSVCRRQATAGVAVLLEELARAGLRTHCFGMKSSGLLRSAGHVVSADSLAWSFAARRQAALPACRQLHRRCNNCLDYALRWRARLLAAAGLGDDGPTPQPRLLDIPPPGCEAW